MKKLPKEFKLSYEDFNDLIYAIGYALDSIDVRATDPRRYEAKEKSAEILEKLVLKNRNHDTTNH